jgi:hypothetical protein
MWSLRPSKTNVTYKPESVKRQNVPNSPPPEKLTPKYQVLEWYREVKSDLCVCVTCQREDPSYSEPNAELHHVDRSTKCGTVRKLIHEHEHPGKVFEEMQKCVPLCTEHHQEYHKLEKQQREDEIKEKFNFREDPVYKGLVRKFNINLYEVAPRSLITDAKNWKRHSAGSSVLIKRVD